ncbi:MFS transporter [Oligoflexaceae bacterium]|nr:MFS transporter [Oligoflexaceae bacterium]
MKNRKEVVGWCLFDVANSSYTTIIITVFFGRIFSEIIVGADSDGQFQTGNLYWSLLLSSSWALTALSGPLFGAMADSSSRRKTFLGLSVMFCAVFSFLMYFIPIGGIAIAAFLVIGSNLAFSLSENFISSFLPHIARHGDMGKISGWGWGVGYIGGIAAIAVCQFLVIGVSEYNPETYEKLRLAGPTTAALFLLFSVPTFLWVSEPKTGDGKLRWRSAYKELIRTLKEMPNFVDLSRFLVSLFFSSGGLYIVISFTSIYASQEVGITGSYLVMYFIVLNVAAATGSVIFGYLQDRIGSLVTVNITLVIWVISILLIFFLKPLGDLLGMSSYKDLFLIIGVVPGLCLGATQAASRALVGLFSPSKRSAEFFGFWGFSAKFAGVFSIVGFGVLQSFFELRMALLFCSCFFIASLLINLTIDEERGKATALK